MGPNQKNNPHQSSNNKMQLTFFLLPSLAAASILPIKFDFGSSLKSHPSLKSVKQCEGHENDALFLINGTTPDEICMPGTTVINMHTQIREDLPTDLTLNLDLHKITPFPMTVPCLNGVGSCEYELCPMIEDMADTVCPSFPESQPCGCPLLAGEMRLEGIEMPVQDMGPILGEVMKYRTGPLRRFMEPQTRTKFLVALSSLLSLTLV